MQQASKILLVHGAAHDGGCWNLLRPELHARGFATAVLDLPSIAEAVGLAEDAAAVRAAIRAEQPEIVVCHSYGGMPTTAAVAPGDGVRLVVYMCAFMPDRGESLFMLGGDADDEGWVVSDDEVWISAKDPYELFYGMTPRAIADEAVASLRPQSMRAFLDPLEAEPAWQSTRSAYIHTLHDQAILLSYQQAMATRAETTRMLETDHSPFVSLPDETAALVSELVAELR